MLKTSKARVQKTKMYYVLLQGEIKANINFLKARYEVRVREGKHEKENLDKKDFMFSLLSLYDD